MVTSIEDGAFPLCKQSVNVLTEVAQLRAIGVILGCRGDRRLCLLALDTRPALQRRHWKRGRISLAAAISDVSFLLLLDKKHFVHVID